MAFTLSYTIPDEKLNKMIELKVVRIATDDIRKYLDQLVDKDLERFKNEQEKSS